MHLSISNSNQRIADGPWLRIAVLAAILTAAFVGAWEGFWRSRGFFPSLNDDPLLWTLARREVRPRDPSQFVLLGSSRMQLGMNLDEFARVMSCEKPIQLAIDGGSCLPILHHLAETEDFAGTVIADIWPAPIYSEVLPTVPNARIDYYKNATVSQIVEAKLHVWLQNYLAIRRPELFPHNILKSATQGEWPKPLYVTTRLDRSKPADYTLVKTFDLPLYIPRETPPPGDPSGKSPEKWLAEVKHIEDSVSRIQARGGRVVLFYFPSDGSTRQWEEDKWPRWKYWDVLANNTTALTIHPDDYPALKRFRCRDGSHLDYRDTAAFARVFCEVLGPLLRGETPPGYVPRDVWAKCVNLVKDAKVIEAPPCTDGHGFEITLADRPTTEFTVPTVFNPSVLTLDLGRVVRADMLEIVEMAWRGKIGSLDDFAIELSADGDAWSKLHDTGSPGGRDCYDLHPTSTGYDLRDVPGFRFIRLTARRALQDNRLLLQRIFVWSGYPLQDQLPRLKIAASTRPAQGVAAAAVSPSSTP